VICTKSVRRDIGCNFRVRHELGAGLLDFVGVDKLLLLLHLSYYFGQFLHTALKIEAGPAYSHKDLMAIFFLKIVTNTYYIV
jgi:hypothetical protein